MIRRHQAHKDYFDFAWTRRDAARAWKRNLCLPTQAPSLCRNARKFCCCQEYPARVLQLLTPTELICNSKKILQFDKYFSRAPGHSGALLFPPLLENNYISNTESATRRYILTYLTIYGMNISVPYSATWLFSRGGKALVLETSSAETAFFVVITRGGGRAHSTGITYPGATATQISRQVSSES